MTDDAIKIPPTIVVREFAARLGVPVTNVTAELIKNGIMSSLNEEIDFDTAAIIAEDLGQSVVLEVVSDATATETKSVQDYLKGDAAESLTARPPVVVVMGHVDHGKTSLLDAIRQTNVTGGEAGGITQRIGAYQIKDKDRLVTFIDTPGHEAFMQMRARGAKIADVAILVVAADDGVKPQTEETIKIIESAAIPFIVALTKIDKPGANPERVKKELAEKNILAEDYGGKIPFLPVSAKTKTGINELLEAVLLLADVDSKHLMVDPKRDAIGTIIESHIDPKQGPLASVLIHAGTLKIGDNIIVGQVWGKVRSMKNDRGEVVKTAAPSAPVQILGLKAAPQVGDILRVSDADVQELKKKVKSRQMTHHVQSVVGRRPTVMAKKKSETSDEEEEKKPTVEKLFLILKTDTVGSAEAILEAMKKIGHAEVAVEIVQRGLGLISEADVMRAEVAKAKLYGFHVQVSPKADQLARSKGVTIQTFDVIYNLLDEVKARLADLLAPTVEEKAIGRLSVLAVFRNENTFQVVGGKVVDGIMRNNVNAQILRRDVVVTRGKITQLQSNKANVKEVTSGNECGLKVEGEPVIQVGDSILATVTETTKRTL